MLADAADTVDIRLYNTLTFSLSSYVLYMHRALNLSSTCAHQQDLQPSMEDKIFNSDVGVRVVNVTGQRLLCQM